MRTVNSFIGSPIERLEDLRFVRGGGQYVDDLHRPGMLHAAVRACLMLAVQAEGSEVVTIEGLSLEEGLTPLQASFRRHHALQCGFCTPGMITTAHALLSEEPDCDADRVREVLSGNLCRCTGYIPIVEAVLDARPAYGGREGLKDGGKGHS